MPSVIFQSAYADDFLRTCKRANTELAKKELFLQYLTKVFVSDTAAQSLISQLSLGAERGIANIPRGGELRRGRADTQTETVIIEWEKDLAKTGEHAREQLEEYLEGNWRSGQAYRFILIATDGLRWRIYAPDWSRLELGEFDLGAAFKLREVRRFDLTPETIESFPFFLDEILFASQLKAPTLDNIQADFGDTSAAFINSMISLHECAEDLATQSELQVAFEQWRRFLSVAYGRFDDSPVMFLVHTYLSVFAKLIAYAVITRAPLAEDSDVAEVLNGTAFERLNVERFVEDDFFHWVSSDAYLRRLRPMFRELNRRIGEYDLSTVKEDILKGVYQELIDLDTRHALGEYYTPDWLCELVVGSLPLTRESRLLDPACGSGSFLRAAVARLRAENPKMGANALAEQVVGIDIHPLSVQIAKTTMLLALGGDVAAARQPVTLHVYLANSLLVPRETADLFESSFRIAVDNHQHILDVRTIDGPDAFDRIITFCDDMVHRFEDRLDRERFERLARPQLPAELSDVLIGQLFEVYRSMKRAFDEGRDSIWKFILQNSYKPIFLQGRFDVVIGNPPWLTYASVSNAEYQTLLRDLSDSYSVTPAARANMPHLEIAAIFLAHCVNYFLREGGRLAFVLPRSFLSADQHENTRAGDVQGAQLVSVWDLDGVQPLFRVPSCVLFARRMEDIDAKHPVPEAGLDGLTISGRLPRSQIGWEDAKSALTQKKARWYYSRLQSGGRRTRSALTTSNAPALTGTNAYAKRFTQGATIVPRNFFFVEFDGDPPATGSDARSRVNSIRTSDASDREAKAAWKGKKVTGKVEGDYLFNTAISRNVVPFGLVDPLLVVLPVKIEDTGNGSQFKVMNSEEILERGDRYASKWFHDAETIWIENRTEKNAASGVTLSGYLDWQSKLVGQNPSARYLVLYTSSSTDASAVVMDRRTFDYPFVVDHKTYWCECASEEEGHYVAAYLNSNFANAKIKDFQSRGLFGPRDVHKTILKLPFPKFQKKEANHVELARLGRSCATSARSFISENNIATLDARSLGRARSNIRRELADQLDEIDKIVSLLSTGKSQAIMRAASSRRKMGSAKGTLL